METASLLAAAGHLDPRHAYALVSNRARQVLGMPAALLRAGDAADFLAIRAGGLTEAVAGGTEDRMVWRHGRLVARTTVRWETGAVEAGTADPGTASA
jgi:cytosine deaminase